MRTEASDGTGATPDDSIVAPSKPSLLPLVKVISHKQVTHLVRYPVNTAALFFSMFVFFGLLFFGGRAIAGSAITDSADGIIVGFFLWTLATRAFRGLADDIMAEARWGTLERLFMSPYGLGTVMAVKTLVNICLDLVWSGVMLLLMMLVTGRWLHIDFITIIPLLLFTIAPIVGFGFLLGGLALLYKRIESLFGIIVFGFVGLIAAPVEQYAVLKLLPVAQGSYLTRVAMERGVPFWSFPAQEVVLLVVPSVVYLLVGYYCFHRAQRRARKRGLLGQY